MNTRRSLTLVLTVVSAFVLLAVVAPAVAAQAPSDGSMSTSDEAEVTNQSVDISVEPVSATAEPGGVVTYEIIVSNATDGISGYANLNITIQDPSVASFTSFYETANDNVGPGEQPPFSTSEIRQNGTQLYLNAALADGTFDGAQEIVIAEANITAIGSSGDETPVVVESGPELQDLNGSQYSLGALENSSLVIDPIEIFLEPASITAQPGGTYQAELVVSGATGGIAGYKSLNISIQDPSVATFTGFFETANDNVGQGEQPPFSQSEIRQNGTQLYLNAALADGTFSGAENITIATVNITAIGSLGNETLVTVADDDNTEIQDNQTGDKYAIGATGDMPFELTGIDVNGDGNFATDPDDDGLYEDVDGDEAFDIFDVQTFFNNFDEPIVQNNAELFDYDNSGIVDIFDVQTLFSEV